MKTIASAKQNIGKIKFLDEKSSLFEIKIEIKKIEPAIKINQAI